MSERTLRDYESYWKFLAPVFGKVDIDKMKPEYLMRYFHERSSKYRAKREVKFLSLIFNWARARGLMSVQNPATGIIRQMKATSRRTIYVTDSDFSLVYQHGNDLVKNAMDIAYLTGQRPADVFKMKWSDISDGVLYIEQNKTGEHVRIAVTGKLAEVFDRIRSRKIIGKTVICDDRGNRSISLVCFVTISIMPEIWQNWTLEKKESCSTASSSRTSVQRRQPIQTLKQPRRNCWDTEISTRQRYTDGIKKK